LATQDPIFNPSAYRRSIFLAADLAGSGLLLRLPRKRGANWT
jgi:hypothetical protein